VPSSRWAIGEQPAATGAHLRRRRQVLLEQLVVRHHRDRGRVRPDERERPVLELRRRVRLRVQVRHLLELLRALTRDRPATDPADEHHVLVLRVVAGERGDLLLAGEDLGDLRR
jgi:hypothetical protein